MSQRLIGMALTLVILVFSIPAWAGETLLGKTAFAGDLDKAAKDTTIDGEFGLQFRSEDMDVQTPGVSDIKAGWLYTDLEVETGSFKGFRIGLGATAVQRLWDNDIGDNNVFNGNVFQDNHDAYWTEVYVTYDLPNTKTRFILGRADDGKFGEPASGDGDYYQGFGVTIKDIPRLKIRAHAVNEWTNDASASWDFDGIQNDWTDLADENIYAGLPMRAASGWAYTLMVGIDLVDDMLSITPYVQHQGDVGTSFGAELEAFYRIDKSISLGLEGAYASFSEDTPNDLRPDDGNISQYVINPFIKYHVDRWKFKFGGGYYGISNDIAPFNTLAEGGDDFEDLFIWDEFDPMEEDIAKYGEQPNNDTYFLHGSIAYGPVELKIIYGWLDNAIVEDGLISNGEGSELDVYLSVDITDSIDFDLIYCDINDDFYGSTGLGGNTDPNRSFSHISGRFRLKF